MNPVTIAEAAEKLSDLIDAALRGEEVIITKGDRISVKLTPTTPVKPRQPGSATGQVWMSKDFDEPLEDFKEYM
jgi:antitoxin (DNA-binding transcriptional repressor) of toxin-antitoxin stability system